MRTARDVGDEPIVEVPPIRLNPTDATLWDIDDDGWDKVQETTMGLRPQVGGFFDYGGTFNSLKNGEMQVLDAAVSHRFRPAPEIIEALFSLSSDAHRSALADDRTALVVRR